MDSLFRQLPLSLGLTRTINIQSTTTTQKDFDLADSRGKHIILQKNCGDTTYTNSLGKELYILDFEDLRGRLDCSNLNKEKITRRCDYFIADKTDKSICVFSEITIAKDIYGLEIPIKNKKGNVQYQGGKIEKGQEQLLHSLKCVEKCLDLWAAIQSFNKKICLFSYKLSDTTIPEQNAFNSSLEFENDENGTQYPNKEIEGLGFEYRRIGYFPFKIS